MQIRGLKYMLVGHQGVIGALSSQLPPVSIITGPPSVGKRLIAAHAAMTNNISRVDFTEVGKLTVNEASRIKDFMSVSPMSNLKFALIDLDNASDAAINDLLQALEYPPKYARFSLISSKRVPHTLRTRAGHKFTVGLLKPEELFQILVSKGIKEDDASKASTLGRVDLAIAACTNSAARTTALTVLESAASNDYVLFAQAFKAVDDNTAKVIINMLEEAASQKWKLFNPNYLGPFSDRRVALAVLSSWSTVATARPKLAVRAALESIMRG
jgi:hypothetical protein